MNAKDSGPGPHQGAAEMGMTVHSSAVLDSIYVQYVRTFLSQTGREKKRGGRTVFAHFDMWP